MCLYSKKFDEYSVSVLDVLTANSYQKIAKIADRCPTKERQNYEIVDTDAKLH